MSFKDALKEDLKVFTNPDEYGVEATFSRSGKVIEILLEALPDEDTGRFVDYVTVALSDVEGVQAGDTFNTGEFLYKVVSSKPELVGELMGMLRVEQ